VTAKWNGLCPAGKHGLDFRGQPCDLCPKPGSSHLVAVDPGLRGAGVSYWWPDGTLRLATYVTGDSEGNGPKAWAAVTASLAKSCEPCWTEKPVFVLELPQVYRTSRAPDVDPNDLIQLAAVVGDMAGALRPHASAVHVFQPRTWKGQVPKDVHHRRVKAKLRPAELHSILLPAQSLRHNVLDAIALGLFYLKREGVRS
jgi:hypothetical protein